MSRTQIGRGWSHAFALHHADGRISEMREAENTTLPQQTGPSLWLSHSEFSEKPYGHWLEKLDL